MVFWVGIYAREAVGKWEVYGTYYYHAVEIPNVALLQVDLREYQQVKELFAAIKPDAVIHCAAASKPNYCQQNPQESYAINVTASVNICQLRCGVSNTLCFYLYRFGI